MEEVTQDTVEPGQTPVDQAEPAPTVEQEPVDVKEDTGLLTTDEKFKQHARTWEKRAKESHARVEELEAQLAELTQARDAAVTARDEALAEKAGVESSLTRYRVGRELGLPDLMCDRLQGETEAELRSDAERVAKLMGRSPVDLSKLSGGFEPNALPRVDPVEIVNNMPKF